jgi:hypothetical protein
MTYTQVEILSGILTVVTWLVAVAVVVAVATLW